ncbi:hypothetical protein BX600DRAFT_518457 [Xylariales sp. PMI_506]|nr:hypothetical protein BX600DRAFT_518457 [Xylariales sp. PMI_506]
MSDTHPVRILVTGFGAFQDISVNPSFEIIKRLPSSLPGTGIEIIAHPEPLKAAYHSLLQISPQLIQRYNPDIVLHIGLAVERDYFAVEQTAQRDGYHQYPDVERKVITKSEVHTIWGKKSAESLKTSLDLERAVDIWKRNLKSRAGGATKTGKGHKGAKKGDITDVRLSDDVGTYVCGLVYYTSLAEMSKRNDGARNVVFLHVPPLSGDVQLETGTEAVLSLILALVETI